MSRDSTSRLRKYDGKVIYSCRDEEGVIDIVEEPATRSMHFGSPARQTTMFRHAPKTLALAYSRCMMAALLFIDDPGQVLLLGLGGGSMAKFLLHYFPDCRVDAVEKRSRIVELARLYFFLPDDSRLNIFVEDAASFLRHLKPRRKEEYDLILVDLHDHRGMAEEQGEADFFACCRRSMSRRGALAVNLWSGEREDLLGQVSMHLECCFGKRVLQIPVAGKRNTVALCFRAPLEDRTERAYRRAEELARRTGVEFPRLLRELIRCSRQRG